MTSSPVPEVDLSVMTSEAREIAESLRWWQRLWRWFTGPHYPPIDAETYEALWYQENGGKCHGG